MLKPGTLLRLAPSERDGLIGVVADLIEFDSRYEKLADYLLSRTLLATDMDAAIALSKRHNGWSKIVTLEGELLTPGGALTGGSLGGSRGSHLVGRKGEMDDLSAALPKTKAGVEKSEARLKQLAVDLTDIENRRSQDLQEESRLAAEIASLSTAHQASVREGERLLADHRERANAGDALSAQAEQLKADREKLQAALETDATQSADADDALTALNDETRTLIARRDECRQRSVTLEVETSRLREKRDGLIRSLASDRAALGGMEIQLSQRLTQRAVVKTEGEGAEEERGRLTGLVAEAKASVRDTSSDYALRQDVRAKCVARNTENSNSLRQAMTDRSELVKSLHDTELRLAKREVTLAQCVERLREEYGIGKEKALARPKMSRSTGTRSLRSAGSGAKFAAWAK